MSANATANSSVWIVTVHDLAPQGYLAFDLRDILCCLGPVLYSYSWLITELDCTGAETEPFAQAVARNREQGLVLSAEEFWSAAQKIQQTIDATAIGIPKKAYSSQELNGLRDIWRFPETQAQLVIRAVDSSYFEIMTKDYHTVHLMKQCFKDVQDEEANKYFLTPAAETQSDLDEIEKG
jgi:hypothetical protein